VPITESNWENAVSVVGEPVPLPAGTTQSFVVGGLTPGGTYYFAIRARDDAGNWSGVSNTACGYAKDGNWDFESGDYYLSGWASWGQVDGVQSTGWWNITAHSGNRFVGTACMPYCKKEHGGVYQEVSVQQGKRYKASVWVYTHYEGGSDPWADVCRIGVDPTGGTDPQSSNIEWSEWVTSQDTWSYVEKSVVASSDKVTIFLEHWQKWAIYANVTCFDDVSFYEIDTTSPAAVCDLSAAPGPAGGDVVLRWTAPGDDGITGVAAQYDIRYATVPITESNWCMAVQLCSRPAPLPAGTTQTWAVDNLISGETYYFALKAADEQGNWSGISNVAATYANPWMPLRNAGFESGNLSFWRVWGYAGEVHSYGWHSDHCMQPHTGDYFLGAALQWQKQDADGKGGVYQQISAHPGSLYKVSVWVRTYQEGGQNWDALFRIGIDPTGGTNPGVANIVWSGWLDSQCSWARIEVSTVAVADKITIFIERWQKWALFWTIHAFDDVEDLYGQVEALQHSV
jgi:hypothetical protein